MTYWNLAPFFSLFGQFVAYCLQWENTFSFYWNQIQCLLRFYALSYGFLALILLEFTFFFNLKVFAHFSRFLVLSHYHVIKSSHVKLLTFKIRQNW